MSKAEFHFKDTITTLQCINNESMDDICKRFLKKYFIDNKKLNFFYSGKEINFGSTYSEMINSSDKKKKLMPIIISENLENDEDNPNIIKSSQIICPKCSENCKFSIKDFKIKLYDCPNKHITKNILLEDFENSQNINISKIKCSKCKNNFEFNNEINKMYICTTCEQNFCFKCKLEHNKSHDFINYEEKNYICKSHNRFYDTYCQTCKKNICIICYSEHSEHEIKSYGYLIPKSSKLSEDLIDLSDTINNMKNQIDEIINKLNRVKTNIEIYLKWKTNIICNFNNRYINYEILHNLKKIKDSYIINIFDYINKNENDNIKNKFQNIMKIYEKMTNKNENINIVNDNKNKIIFNNNSKALFNLNLSEIKYDDDLNSSNISKEEKPLLINIKFNSKLKNGKEEIKEEKRKEKDNIDNSKDDIKNVNNTLDEEEKKIENNEIQKDSFLEEIKDDMKLNYNDDDNIYESNYSSTNVESNIFRNINNNRALKKRRKCKKKYYGSYENNENY